MEAVIPGAERKRTEFTLLHSQNESLATASWWKCHGPASHVHVHQLPVHSGPSRPLSPGEALQLGQCAFINPYKPRPLKSTMRGIVLRSSARILSPWLHRTKTQRYLLAAAATRKSSLKSTEANTVSEQREGRGHGDLNALASGAVPGP